MADGKNTLLELISTPVTGDTEGQEGILVKNTLASSAPSEPFVDSATSAASETPSATSVASTILDSAPTNLGTLEKDLSSFDDPNRKLTKEEADAIRAGEKTYREALAFVRDSIAPAMMKIDAGKLQIGNTFVRSVFVYAYPSELEGNWLSPLINWDVKFDMSMFIYPIDSGEVMKYLKRRLGELGSERSMNIEK